MGFLKTKKGKIIVVFAALIVIAAIVVVIFLLSGSQKGYRTISVSEISGDVLVENNGSEYAAYPNMTLHDGYALTTEAESYIRMVLDSDKYVKLEELSRAYFEALGKAGSGSTVIRLERGAITNEITKPLRVDEEYVINTPNAVLAVRGTFFRVEVEVDENGEIFTNVLAYDGAVSCRRVMPDGTIVDEEVVVNAGFKATIKMDNSDTVYVVQQIDDEEKTVVPISMDDIPDGDLVAMYVASENGYGMFIADEEIWAIIEERGISVEEYLSQYDGSRISAPVISSVTSASAEESRTSPPETTVTTAPAATTTEETTTTIPETEKITEITEIAEITSDTVVTEIETQATTSVTEVTTTFSAEEYEETVTATEASKAPETDEPVAEETAYNSETEAETEPTTETTAVTKAESKETIIITSVISAPVYSTPVANIRTVTTAVIPDAEAHVHQFGDYVSDNNATCTEDGTKTAVCVCGETDTVTEEGTAAAHTVETETVEATFAEEGVYREYCTVCGEELTTEVLDRIPALYLEDGNVTITSSGYTQGDETVAYTGDYTISQNDSSVAVDAAIVVLSGTHNITLDGVNIFVTGRHGIEISAGASVTLGGIAASTVYVSDDGVDATECSGLYNLGTVNILSGTITFNSDESIGSGIYNEGTITLTSGAVSTLAAHTGFNNFGTLAVNGGSLTVNSSIANEEVINITGGAVCASGELSGITNLGTVTISGGICSFTGTQAVYSTGITNRGTFRVSGGKITAAAETTDINNEVDFEISGGSIIAASSGIYASPSIVVTGGSIRNAGGYMYGSFTNGLDELESVVYDTFPDETARTFVKSDGTSYVYALTAADTADDGKYYLWKPSY